MAAVVVIAGRQARAVDAAFDGVGVPPCLAVEGQGPPVVADARGSSGRVRPEGWCVTCLSGSDDEGERTAATVGPRQFFAVGLLQDRPRA